MAELMNANPTQAATWPRVFNRDSVDQRRLLDVIDLFNSRRFPGQGPGRARDLLGEVYEYLLEKFAREEGRRGGEFYTPADVVRVLVEVLEPTSGRVYDPCCGSGGMFVKTVKFLVAHNEDRPAITVYGKELNDYPRYIDTRNMAVRYL